MASCVDAVRGEEPGDALVSGTLIGRGQTLQLPDDVKDVNELAQRPRGVRVFAARLRGLTAP